MVCRKNSKRTPKRAFAYAVAGYVGFFESRRTPASRQRGTERFGPDGM